MKSPVCMATALSQRLVHCPCTPRGVQNFLPRGLTHLPHEVGKSHQNVSAPFQAVSGRSPSRCIFPSMSWLKRNECHSVDVSRGIYNLLGVGKCARSDPLPTPQVGRGPPFFPRDKGRLFAAKWTGPHFQTSIPLGFIGF